jgi:methyl acetate hydrolase
MFTLATVSTAALSGTPWFGYRCDKYQRRRKPMVDTNALAAPLRQAANTGDLPGIAATAGTEHEVLFEGAYGMRDIHAGIPMTIDTVVWIASMTKAITSACAMQLVEQGKLSLDGDIAGVLPELKHPRVLDGFDAAGKPLLRPAKRAITLRHLLTHTAGYAYDMWNPDLARFMAATGTPGIVSCQDAALALPLIADPGDAWSYGISIDWAGKAIEAVSGQTLDRYMHQNLLQPLGMTDTGFRIGTTQRERLARVHVRAPDGLTPIGMEVPQEPEFHMGGGGLYATVGDYLTFARMILGKGALNGVRVLQLETVATMSANAMGDLFCQPMISAVPSATNDVPFVDGMKWGLSFMINPTALPTGRSAGSLAWAGLANTYFWIDPHRGVAGVFATQLLPFADNKALAACAGFEAAVYQSLAA